MGSTLGIALLLGLVGAFAIYDYAIGTNYIFRPLVTGVLVGIVMGDVRQGTIIGASLELMFMGAVSVGAYIPPDIVTGGILGTAFAIGLGKDTGIAMALALPISMIALVVNNLVFMLGTVIATRADKYAAEGNAKGVFRVMNFFGFIRCLSAFILVFAGYYLGSDVMQKFLDSIPAFITNGLSVAAGLLPAVGIAVLAKMILNKQLIPFLFLGFVLCSYFNAPILAVAIIGIIIAVEKSGLLAPKGAAAEAAVNTIAEEDEDDDF